ncbi:MAG: TrbI F-type domain-containing protein [Brevundimonas sp.]
MDNNKKDIQSAPPASKQRGRWQAIAEGVKAYVPSKGQAAFAAIALLAISNGFAWAKLAKVEASPVIMTVGISQLTKNYMAELALSNLPPEEVGVRTELFLSVTQDTLRRAATEDNVLLIAREAVLAGNAIDVTEDVNAAVKAAMKQAADRRGAPQQALPKTDASSPLILGQ